MKTTTEQVREVIPSCALEQGYAVDTGRKSDAAFYGTILDALDDLEALRTFKDGVQRFATHVDMLCHGKPHNQDWTEFVSDELTKLLETTK